MPNDPRLPIAEDDASKYLESLKPEERCSPDPLAVTSKELPPSPKSFTKEEREAVENIFPLIKLR